MRRRKASAGARVCVLVSFVVVLAGAALMAAPALAALPEGRVYEQVSPEFKAGYPVLSGTGYGGYDYFALNGESARFASVGGFSGTGEDFSINPYVARRTSEGWVTSALFPSPSMGGAGVCWVASEEMTPELSRFEYLVAAGSIFADCEKSRTDAVGFREPDGSFVQTFPALTTSEASSYSVDGGSSDLSHVVFKHPDAPGEHIIPDETVTDVQLFEQSGGAPRLVGVDNAGQQLTRYCEVELGGSSSNVRGGFDAVSQPDASEVFFSVPIDTRESTTGQCPEGAGHPSQLFVRVNGASTVEVSKPLSEACGEVPCPGAQSRAPAVFQGASEDGSVVFFTTTEPLVEGDSDRSNNLYMARIGTNGSGEPAVTELVLVSRDPHTGQAAEVQPRVMAVSPDGSHVYFVARGVLSEGANAEGQAPLQGADNLYVYDAGAAGKTAFIADLCSGPEQSGSANDARCPHTLTAGENDSSFWILGDEDLEGAQTTEDGSFLVFSTYGQLISSGPEADTDAAKDVYRYDAQSERLQRVSIGENGLDGNGNNSAFNASIARTTFRGSLQEQYELGDRAITENGSTIVFTSAEPLSAGATNGQPNVYVWHEGHVGMISSGTSVEADEEPVITPSGRDIFFITSAGLVSGDTDGLSDIYDARIGGGFPSAPAGTEECSGDACQGPLSSPAPLLVSGSISQAPGGDFPAPVTAPVARSKQKGTTRKCAQGKRLSRGKCVKGKTRYEKPKAKKAGHAKAKSAGHAKAKKAGHDGRTGR